jgi:hypothetical protein
VHCFTTVNNGEFGVLIFGVVGNCFLFDLILYIIFVYQPIADALWLLHANILNG